MSIIVTSVHETFIFNCPSITINIGHIQLYEAGYLMLISFLNFFFFFFLYFGVNWLGANLEGESVRGLQGGSLQCGCDTLGNPRICY